MGISGTCAIGAREGEAFWGDKVAAGATGQLSEVGGITGKVVRVEGLAEVEGVEVPLAAAGAIPSMAALSKGDGATGGVVKEVLRGRLVGSGLVCDSVLITETGGLALREEEVLAGFTTGRGPGELFAARVASGERAVSGEGDVLWGEGGFLGAARAAVLGKSLRMRGAVGDNGEEAATSEETRSGTAEMPLSADRAREEVGAPPGKAVPAVGTTSFLEGRGGITGL